MKYVSIVEAKARFSQLVKAVEHGKQVTITRNGKIVRLDESVDPAVVARQEKPTSDASR